MESQKGNTEPDLPDLWEELRSLVPAAKTPWRRRDRKGGRPKQDDRSCWQAVLWRLRSGRSWRFLPKPFGSPKTVRRRLALWQAQGVLEALWRRYLELLPAEERRNWRGNFDPASKKKRDFWYWDMLGRLWAMTAQIYYNRDS